MSRVRFAFGYDTERPYGAWAHDAQARARRAVELDTVARLGELFAAHAAPRTFFVVGEFLAGCERERGCDELRQIFRVGDARSDIQSHSHTHQVFRPVPGRGDKRLQSAAEFGADCAQARAVLAAVLGVDAEGVRTPLGYPHDLGDRPDVLRALRDAGVRWVSSHCRGTASALWPELSAARQPHTYSDVGFAEFVEIPSSGWQDVIFTAEHAHRELGCAPASADAAFAHYDGLLTTAAGLAAAGRRDIDVCLCLHPWAVAEWDPQLDVHARLLASAQRRGVTVVSYAEIAHGCAGRG